ncbi:MAG: DUF3237 domain-containing protein [Deltaproteobacteria bacterium]|nr:DUF3237 domain-containing protein [Deltaproteobacteria bacterium]
MPSLEYEFTYRAALNPLIDIGAGPYGNRIVGEVIGGDFSGPRLKGKVLSGGADWALVGADGRLRIDVRLQLLSDDGAAIYLAYYGILEFNEKMQQALAQGGGTEFADHYWRTNPRFETGHPKYAWMNHGVFIGEGRMLPGRIAEYRVYRVS